MRVIVFSRPTLVRNVGKSHEKLDEILPKSKTWYELSTLNQ